MYACVCRCVVFHIDTLNTFDVIRMRKLFEIGLYISYIIYIEDYRGSCCAADRVHLKPVQCLKSCRPICVFMHAPDECTVMRPSSN